MEIILTINCREEDNKNIICERLRKCSENGRLTSVRINIKSFTKDDMDRVNKILDGLNMYINSYHASLRVYVDLPFPGKKIRIRTLRNKQLHNGQVIKVMRKYTDEINDIIWFNSEFDNLTNEIDNVYYYGDGEGSLQLLKKTDDFLSFLVINNFKLIDNKSISIGYIKTEIIDSVYIDFIQNITKKYNIYAFFLSFCSEKKDIDIFRKIINNPRIKVMGKIESEDAVKNMNEIICASDGVMIARGDLAMYVKLPYFLDICDKIVSNAKLFMKDCYYATDVLSSLEDRNFPKRGDLVDINYIITNNPTGVILKSSFYFKERYNIATQFLNEMI